MTSLNVWDHRCDLVGFWLAFEGDTRDDQGMSQTASPGIRAYRESINLEIPELVSELREALDD